MGLIWSRIGIDECFTVNKKDSRIVHFAVNSTGEDRETIELTGLRRKQRLHEKTLVLRELENRLYAFSAYPTKDVGKIEYERRMGIILAGLLCSQRTAQNLEIYIDGILNPTPQNFAKKAVSKVTGLPEFSIRIYCGKGLDGIIPLVNLAHRGAFHFSRMRREEYLQHPNISSFNLLEIQEFFDL